MARTARCGWLRFRWAVIVAGSTLAIAPAYAQISSKQVQDRYQRETKGGTKLEDFVKKLESSDADQRLEGVKSLGESKEPKATAYLIQAVGDPDARVQCKAIDLLANLRADDATPVLVQYLFRSDVDPQEIGRAHV